MKRSISIVIPNWNGKELLKRNVPSLVEAMDHYGGEYEIIIVDDASSDGSPQFIRDTHPSVKLVVLERNSGFSVAVNRGVREARQDLVLLLNSDMKVDKGFLSPLVGYFDEERTFAVANKAIEGGNTALTRPHIMEFKYGFLREIFTTRQDEPSLAFGASGGHGLFDRKKLLELDGFDEVYSPFYYEDADLSYRAWKRGYSVHYEPRSVVHHENQATIGKAFSKWRIHFIFNRNKLVFLWKNITDSDLRLQHFIFLPFYLIVNMFKNPVVLLSFFAAIGKTPAILKSRRIEKTFIRYGDKDVLKLIGEGQ